jgi:hypothetical protein
MKKAMAIPLSYFGDNTSFEQNLIDLTQLCSLSCFKTRPLRVLFQTERPDDFATLLSTAT